MYTYFKKLFFLKNIDKKSILLYKNIFFSLGVKGMAIIVSLVNMPMFMDYFQDSTVLGLWFAVLSTLNWILSFDLGIGNGLRNYLVIAIEKDDKEEIRQLISSSYCSVGIIVVILSLVIYTLVPFLNWNIIFNVPADCVSPTVLNQTVIILLIGILLQFLLKLINSILYAMQKSAIPNFLLLISNVLLLIATVILRTDDVQKNLIRLANAYIFTANIPILLVTFFVFSTTLKDCSIKISYWKKEHTAKIIKLGCSFLMLQLLSMASLNTREFYIMRFISPDGVVPYQIYHKIFSLISTFFILATTPFWSAITQAVAQNDSVWIKQTYKKGVLLFALFSGGSILIVIIAPCLVNFWLGEKAISINIIYSILFAVVNIEYMWISLHSNFENGLGRLKIQKIGYIIAAILLPVISFFLTVDSKNWIMIVSANTIALIPLCIMQPIYLKKWFTNNKT